MRKAINIILIVGGFALLSMNGLQMSEVPANVQVSLVMKATPYCRTLSQKLVGSNFVVGICYQEKNRSSYVIMEALREEFKKLKGNPPVQVDLVGLDNDGKPVEGSLDGKSALYLTPMRGANMSYILSETAKRDIWTIAVDPNDCRKGATMSFELVDARPKFLINMKSATAENCDFSSQLLKLALTL